MKNSFVLPAVVLVGFLTVQVAHALLSGDSLFAENITFTGSVTVETGTDGKTVVKPITIPDVVSILAVTSTDKLRYYYDSTASSYVIAPKGIPNGSIGTPLATVLALTGSNAVTWNPTVNSTVNAETVAGLNGNLTGIEQTKEVIAAGTETSTLSFILSGTMTTGSYAGDPAIMKGTIVDIFHP